MYVYLHTYILYVCVYIYTHISHNTHIAMYVTFQTGQWEPTRSAASQEFVGSGFKECVPREPHNPKL